MTVTVNGTGEQVELTARRAIVLNTGTDPLVPDVPGLADSPFWTNRDILTIEKAPESLAVLGGGAIGSELAQAFARFGTRVSIIGHAPRLLPYEEPESSELVEAAFADDGIDVHNGVDVTAVALRRRVRAGVRRRAGGRGAGCWSRRGGAAPCAELGVDVLGLDPDARHLPADEHLRVADGVWAIGDITGQGAFTHMSMYQAAIAYRDIMGEPGARRRVPRGAPRHVHRPEVGSVGLSEAQAARQAG